MCVQLVCLCKGPAGEAVKRTAVEMGVYVSSSRPQPSRLEGLPCLCRRDALSVVTVTWAGQCKQCLKQCLTLQEPMRLIGGYTGASPVLCGNLHRGAPVLGGPVLLVFCKVGRKGTIGAEIAAWHAACCT